MSRLVVLAIACAVVCSGGQALALTASPDGSWPDPQHGWARYGDGLGCAPRADLCSTSDGGATWRGIFTGNVDSFVRTSARAGVVSVAGGGVYWTRDDGRHWYRTARIFGRFAGIGARLYATSDADLYRVAPWPPRGRARCSMWRRMVAGDGGRSSSTVCAGRAVEAGMRDELATTVHGSTIGALAAVPGGVFGVVDYEPDFSHLDAFVWRSGHLTQTPLPFPKPGWWCCAEVDVAWPALFVSGSLYSPPGSAADPVPLLWRSGDGGSTWHVYSGSP